MRTLPDFHARRPLGQTGLSVSRLGIGSSFGAPARVIEEACERGVNFLYWGSVRRPAFGRAMRHLARRGREDLVLTVQSYSRVPALIAPSVDVALLRAGLEYFDILLLGMRNDLPAEAYVEAFERIRERGKVRHLALSTHNRPMLPQRFDEVRRGESPFEAFMGGASPSRLLSIRPQPSAVDVGPGQRCPDGRGARRAGRGPPRSGGTRAHGADR